MTDDILLGAGAGPEALQHRHCLVRSSPCIVITYACKHIVAYDSAIDTMLCCIRAILIPA